MAKVVFIGLSARGHVNPTLAIVRELVHRGEEVIYIAHDNYKGLLESIGCKHLEFKYSWFLFGSHHLTSDKRRTEDEFLTSVSQFYDSIEYQITLAGKLKRLIMSLNPDYIIHDSTLFYMKYICCDLNIPCISSVSLFALTNEMFIMSPNLLSDFYNVNLESTTKFVVDRINKIAYDSFLKCGYKHDYLDNAMTKQGLNIIYTSKAFQPYTELLDESYHFAGNNLEFRKSIEVKQSYNLSEQQKVILISFGSIISGSHKYIDMYSEIMSYFCRYDATFIINIGKISKSSFDSIPSNFILENGINQLALLDLADLFITHGGMNSASEALQLNAPMIVLPQAMDQFIVAEQVEKVKIGKRLKSIDFSELENSISELLTNQDYKENARYIAETYRNTGEAEIAVNRILNYVEQNS